VNPDERTGLAVARYLRPEEKVVPFRARPELDELLSWCAAEGHLAVRLVTGDGGAGKTRLALQLIEEMEANGWQPLWVSRGLEGRVVSAVGELGTPCVVVVDYAETRDALGELLSAAARDSGGPDMRVVLLARGSGEWWERLIAGSEERAARLLAVPPVTLGPILVEGGQDELFAEALTAFAEELGVDRPDRTLMLTDPAPVVLVVHAAALLSVLDHAVGNDGVQVRSGAQVLTGLLAHEGRYWAQSAAARGLDLDMAVQRLAVMSGCLIGADTEAAAASLMSRIPDLADSAERRGKVARWLHDLYPETRPDETSDTEWIGPLRPDPVAERLVVSELARRPELIPRLFTGLDEDRAARALTLLGRAAYTQREALNLLRSALAADLEHLAVPALLVAVRTNPVLGELLSETLNDQQISVGMLERVASTAPYPSFALAPVAATVLAQLVAHSTDDDERASRLLGLSTRLGELGRHEDARAANEEAVTICRALARADPAAGLPGLALALNNQSGHLAELGRQEEALAAIEEAVTIRRTLAQADRDALPDLAMSLNNQSLRLGDRGRQGEALAAIEEAVAIRRDLAQVRPDVFLPDLARALNNQSIPLAELGRQEEAMAVMEEAAGLYRALAQGRPDAFLPTFAGVLYNLSIRLAESGRQEEVLAAIREASSIYRALAQARPHAFLPTFSGVLYNLFSRLAESGRQEEALAAIREASSIYRALIRAHLDAFLPTVAGTLNNMSIRLSELGWWAEALATVQEVTLMHRDLARGNPATFLPVLATSLNTQSVSLAELGQAEEALAVIEEAVGIYRDLARDDPAVFSADLAGVLSNRAGRLVELGRQEEALAVIEETVRIRRELAEARPDAFLYDLATALQNLAIVLSMVGRDADASAIRDEAASIRASARERSGGADGKPGFQASDP
jgi:tetratricopeptide (TPR) repeat protein